MRTAIEKIGGTMPEDLPTPEKSIQQIEKEQMERLKLKAKKGKLMLDELALDYLAILESTSIICPDQTFTQNLLSDGVDIYRNKSSICSI